MWRDDANVLDMLIAARDALGFAHGLTREALADSALHQNAIMHVLQIIGEAANKVSADYRAAHPEVPWTEIIGLRHRLVHEYRNIDAEKVWLTLQSSVPRLIEVLEPLVPPPSRNA